VASAPDEYRQLTLDNLDCAACGIKTAGLIDRLVIGTGEPLRYRKAIDPNGSGLDKRNSRTHSVFFLRARVPQWQLSERGGSARSSEDISGNRKRAKGLTGLLVTNYSQPNMGR